MKYRCRKGCMKTRRNGDKVPMWHDRTSDCPFEPNYAGPKIGESPAGTSSVATPAPAPSTSLATPASRPAGPGALSFGSKPATTTTRTAPAATQVQVEWEVDSDHSLSLFELFDTIIVRGIRFVDGALSSEEYEVRKFEGHVLINTPADEELVKKKMGRSMATTFTKALGAKTQEEAHGLIDSGGLLVLVGGGLFSVGSHILEEYPKALKAKAKLRKAKKEKLKGAENFPAPSGTALPDGTVAK